MTIPTEAARDARARRRARRMGLAVTRDRTGRYFVSDSYSNRPGTGHGSRPARGLPRRRVGALPDPTRVDAPGVLFRGHRPCLTHCVRG
jgi:hypothetical protein